MKLSKRLETIVSFIDDKDNVLDIGCDHAYIDIYLALNKKNKLIIASDISEDVIKTTKKNLKQYNVEDKVKVYCTDGADNIKDDYDTIILAGMGSTTILDILKRAKKVKKIVICSHNNWESIRKDVSNIGYYLDNEKLIYDRNKLYSIMVFCKGNRKLSKKEILIGKYNKDNIQEYNIYYDNIKNIYKKIPKSKFFKKYYYYKILKYINSYLMKENR